MFVPALQALLGKGRCKSSLLGLESQLCPVQGCVVHQVLSRGRRRARPGWHGTGVSAAPGSARPCRPPQPSLASRRALPQHGGAPGARCPAALLPAAALPCREPDQPQPRPTLADGPRGGTVPAPRCQVRGPQGRGISQQGTGQPWHHKEPRPPPVAPCCALLSALPRAAMWEKAGGAQEGLPPRPRCVRCCEPPDQRFSYPQYQPLPQINMTILKGEGWRGPVLWHCPRPHRHPGHPTPPGTTSLPGLPASRQGQHKAGLLGPALWGASLPQTGSKKLGLVPVVQRPAWAEERWG